MPRAPTFAELYRPKLLTVLREGYGLPQLTRDAIAGLTVAIVALPLSMAIAIASGASPARALHRDHRRLPGLGARRQPLPDRRAGRRFHRARRGDGRRRTGSTACCSRRMMSGVFLLAVGYLRLGTYIKFIPYPVTVGFTAGIAVIILASQIKDLLGLTLAGPEPGELLAKLPVLWRALPDVRRTAVVRSRRDDRRHRRHSSAGGRVARHADRRRGRSLAVTACCRCRSRRSARGSAASRAAAAAVAARRRLGQRCGQCCRTPSPSRCSAPSSRCCRPSSPTA